MAAAILGRRVRLRRLGLRFRLLAQDELLDLAGAGLGQLVDEDDGLRHLEAGQTLTRALLQLLDVLLVAGARAERDRILAPALVRGGDARRLGDRVVVRQRLLDLDRG